MSDSGPSAKKPKLMKRGRKRKPAEEVADDGDDEGNKNSLLDVAANLLQI